MERFVLSAFGHVMDLEVRMVRGVLTSFPDGFALAGLVSKLRSRDAPTRPFAPFKPKMKMVIVVDDELAVERPEGLR